MSRAREFDEQVAIERAMHLFWRRGYEASTLPDLLTSMSMSRGSFYNAFGTKREVLVRAVHHYTRTGMDGLLAPLAVDNAGRAEIEQTFARLLDYMCTLRGRQGCLIGNTMTDLAMQDAELKKLLLRARQQTEDALTRAFANGQASGTITHSVAPRSAGRFLLNTLSGLMVSCKTNPGRAELDDIINMALRVLD